MESGETQRALCADGAEWHVSQCACGQVTLRIGALRVEFTRDEFAQLHRLVHNAMAEFGIAPSAQRVHRLSTKMH